MPEGSGSSENFLEAMENDAFMGLGLFGPGMALLSPNKPPTSGLRI
jgi:hypothetical protein